MLSKKNTAVKQSRLLIEAIIPQIVQRELLATNKAESCLLLNRSTTATICMHSWCVAYSTDATDRRRNQRLPREVSRHGRRVRATLVRLSHLLGAIAGVIGSVAVLLLRLLLLLVLLLVAPVLLRLLLRLVVLVLLRRLLLLVVLLLRRLLLVPAVLRLLLLLLGRRRLVLLLGRRLVRLLGRRLAVACRLSH